MINTLPPIELGPGQSFAEQEGAHIQPRNRIRIDFDSDGTIDRVIDFEKATRSKVFDGEVITVDLRQ